MRYFIFFSTFFFLISCRNPETDGTNRLSPQLPFSASADSIPILFSPKAAAYTRIGFCYDPSSAEDTIIFFNSCFDTSFIASAGPFCLPRLPLDSTAKIFYTCKRCTTFWDSARVNSHDDYFNISDSLFSILSHF